ncbi:MAG: helix-turn-helix transcriptional regulator [Caulobacteraceae bacterium]
MTRIAQIEGPHPIDVDVGLRLRTHRKRRGMSQTQLGELLGITFQQIQKYERGHNRLAASTLVRAARAMNVPVTALLPDEDAPPLAVETMTVLTQTRGAEELVQAYAHIPTTQQRKSVLQLARSLAVTPNVTGAAA